ncbi:adult cuticle protein 1-like [Topomyia yanbarensis]|uniref:adult cuticle protein 1-like n=1 Tax=Topomyia yanbarensis TaxID=2498891 RepID=UPI00273C620A|nr:adult cuticle protein 1-like [Topomyia yanbarensis]
MKCIAAVVMMALAVVAEASYAPAVYAGHYGYAAAPVVTYAAHHGPSVVQSNDLHSWNYAAHNSWNHAPVAVAYNHWNAHHVPAAVAYNSWDSHYAPAAVTYGAAHWNNQWDGHHRAAVVAVAPVEHSASYVAANRGAVHKAPLPGHVVNQKSLNLAPAPGTW